MSHKLAKKTRKLMKAWGRDFRQAEYSEIIPPYTKLGFTVTNTIRLGNCDKLLYKMYKKRFEDGNVINVY